jgi:hypothetical protein
MITERQMIEIGINIREKIIKEIKDADEYKEFNRFDIDVAFFLAAISFLKITCKKLGKFEEGKELSNQLNSLEENICKCFDIYNADN